MSVSIPLAPTANNPVELAAYELEIAANNVCRAGKIRYDIMDPKRALALMARLDAATVAFRAACEADIVIRAEAAKAKKIEDREVAKREAAIIKARAQREAAQRKAAERAANPPARKSRAKVANDLEIPAPPQTTEQYAADGLVAMASTLRDDSKDPAPGQPFLLTMLNPRPADAPKKGVLGLFRVKKAA